MSEEPLNDRRAEQLLHARIICQLHTRGSQAHQLELMARLLRVPGHQLLLDVGHAVITVELHHHLGPGHQPHLDTASLLATINADWCPVGVGHFSDGS